jgi:hypothetical protein
MIEDLYRIRLGSTRDRARPDVIAVGEQAGQELEETVFAHVHIAWRVRRARRSTAVPVSTAISRISSPAVHPVRVHPPTAHTTRHQPSQHIVPGLSVLGRLAGAHPLDREERGIVYQRSVGQMFGDLPLFRRIRPHRA